MLRGMLIFSLGIVVLAGLFWLLRPAPSPPVSTPATPDIITASPVPPPPAPVAVSIEIRNGERVSGPELLRVAQGDTAVLQFTSDKDSELHLHGYDLHVHLHAGKPAELKFKAVHSGRFEYELHGHGGGAHSALGVIEVLPR